MITSNDLKGIMAMMPAFTAKDGDRPEAADTIAYWKTLCEKYPLVREAARKSA